MYYQSKLNMPDFQRGKIYIIQHVFHDEYETYVGSTCNDLARRFATHKSYAKRGTSVVYRYMREHCIINFRIELLEPWPCNNVEELLMREQYWKDKLNPKLNRNNPCRKVSTSEYNTIYRKTNKYKYINHSRNHYHKNNLNKVSCIFCECKYNKLHIKQHEKRCGVSPKHWKAIDNYCAIKI